MKSAYSILGVPGNATTDEISEAFQRAMQFYSREKLVENPELVDRLDEIKTAYKILSDAEMRLAYDRKLNRPIPNPPTRPVLVVEKEPFSLRALLAILTVLVVGMFAISGYLSHSREKARQALAAQELEQKRIDEEAAARAAREKELADQARANRDRLAEIRERELRAESLMVARANAAAETQRQAIAARQAETARNAEKFEENRRAAEAQRKLAEYRQIMRQR
jgi:curved DNA-binding protein CbpA